MRMLRGFLLCVVVNFYCCVRVLVIVFGVYGGVVFCDCGCWWVGFFCGGMLLCEEFFLF